MQTSASLKFTYQYARYAVHDIIKIHRDKKYTHIQILTFQGDINESQTYLGLNQHAVGTDLIHFIRSCSMN